VHCYLPITLISNRSIDILNNIGNIYLKLGINAKAIELFFEAIELAEDFQNYFKIADIYYFLGLSYYEIDDIKRCQLHIKNSIKYSKEFNNKTQLISSYILLSNSFFELDSIQKYLNLANDIIEINPSLQYEKVVLRNNQALINKAIGDYPTAKSQYLEAITISELNGFTEHLANLYNNYAYLLMAEGKYDSAKISLDLALEATLEIQSLDLEASINDSYSDYFKVIGNFEKALEYSDISVAKQNEFVEQQRVQESLFLSVVFETEEKEKEILLKENKLNRTTKLFLGALALSVIILALAIYFRQKSVIRKTRISNMQKTKSLEVANAVIEGQDSERKRLAMDLHDGIGVQLGSLKFQLEAFYGEDENYSKVAGSVDNVGKNIREISHRMSPARLEELGLKQSIQDLINSIGVSDEIDIELISDLDQRLDDKMEINLYYLIFKLINNATKHSQAANITIQLFMDDDSINLSVEDDGIGMDSKVVSEGHGLRNIRQRIQFLNGKLNIESKLDLGTIFMIEIPQKNN
jgi:signal transduction histidine kinase